MVRGEGFAPPPIESQSIMLLLHQPLLIVINAFVIKPASNQKKAKRTRKSKNRKSKSPDEFSERLLLIAFAITMLGLPCLAGACIRRGRSDRYNSSHITIMMYSFLFKYTLQEISVRKERRSRKWEMRGKIHPVRLKRISQHLYKDLIV